MGIDQSRIARGVAWLVTMGLCVSGMVPVHAAPAPANIATQTNVSFSGVVRDVTTGTPIAGASVKINAGSTLTGVNGAYMLTISTATTTFLAVVDAAGYLPISVTIKTGGATPPPLVHFDFVGHFGLQSFSTLTAVISGVVEDAETNKAVPDAAVTSSSKLALANQSGQYLLTTHAAAQIPLETSAMGYQWGPPFLLSQGSQGVVHGRLTVNFTGHWGLLAAFHSANGDALTPFPQAVPAATHSLIISGTAHEPVESTLAVTYPNGDAGFLPLSQQSDHFNGTLTVDHGPGIYHVEISLQSGFALFSLPIYVGVPYTPLLPPPAYAPDNPSIPTSQLEQEALVLINTMRHTYHRLLLQPDARLDSAAQAHSLDVVTHGYFETRPHIGTGGSTPATRISAAGVHNTGVEEDVAAGASVQDAFQSVIDSPAHRAHVVSTLYTSAGVGIVRQRDGRLLLTVDYARELGSPPTPTTVPALTTTVMTQETTPRSAQVLAVQATLGLTTTQKTPLFTEALQLLVPAGTISGGVSLHVATPPLDTVPGLIQGLGHANNVGVGLAFDLTAIDNLTGQHVRQFSFQHPLLLQFSYDPADIAGLDPSTLVVAYYDPATRTWRALPTTIDALHHVLTAATTHFTLFQIRATAHTAAQLTQARARLATLAVAGAPHVATLPRTSAGMITLASVPAGSQHVPLSLSITGTPQTRIRIVYTLPTGRQTQSLTLAARGYVTLLFTPTVPLTTAQPLLITVIATHGSVQQTTTYSRLLQPGAPPLRARLSESYLHATTPGPLLTVTTTRGAMVRVSIQQAGKPLAGLPPLQGTANAHGALTLSLPPLPAALVRSKVAVVLHVVVTAILAGQSSQQTLTLTVGP